MADIFDEIREDLRAERTRALLRRYGGLIVLAAVLLVAGVAGWQVWQWQTHRTAERDATTFLDAMHDSATPPAAQGATPGSDEPLTPTGAKAASAFAKLSSAGPEGYRTLARFREAALQASSGHLTQALNAWDAVSADTGADPLLRGLADLLWVQHQVDQGDPAIVEGRLAPLVAAGNPWRAMAQESQAWLDIRTGKTAQARTTLQRLQLDPEAPNDLRVRARGLLARIGDAPPAVSPKGAGG